MSHKYTLHIDYRERDLYLLISKLIESNIQTLKLIYAKVI